MFSKKSWSVRGVSILFSLLSLSAANAQGPTCYTVASLHGSYAFVGAYAGGIGLSLGAIQFDGNGNLTSTTTVNYSKPGSTTRERTIVTTTQEGTYTVNCNGTGLITRL